METEIVIKANAIILTLAALGIVLGAAFYFLT